jgi:Zn-dependent M28 family amino/carboxypeptidase
LLSPSTSTPAPVAGGSQAPAPDTPEIIVGPLVPATNHTELARMFDEERAFEHIAYLASDELGGRQPGTVESRAAGDYIAARFAAYGLDPAGVNESYFQTFNVPHGRIAALPTLIITPPAEEPLASNYVYRVDYRALTGGYLGAGEGEGPVVWLNTCLHDDYAGLDMEGKIALCYYTREPEVYRQAIEHRVGGLLLLDRDKAPQEQFRRGGYRETAWVPETIPGYLISETVARDLLVGTEYTLDDLSLFFDATPLSTTVTMAVSTEEQDEIEARNVLALLPGSNPEYSDEIVVIGAHYDHIGHEPDGVVMNGANDNASGTAVVLEIARLWQAQGFRPARSVLFAAWDGEEIGLLGAQHYVENSTLSLTDTVAMLNLDMVGVGDIAQIDGTGLVAAQLEASAEPYATTITTTFTGRSDHMPFYGAGIPAAMLMLSSDRSDLSYHTPDDEIDTIEAHNLKTAGVIAAHTLAALAQGHTELQQAVGRMEAAVAVGDRDAFLEGLYPTDPDLQATQTAWFDNLWSQDLARVTIDPRAVRIGDGEADATLHLIYQWANSTGYNPSVDYDARFVQHEDAWLYAGYELEELTGDVVTVASFPDIGVEAAALLTSTEPVYLTLAADLELEPITGTRVIYYPDTATMRAIARPAADREAGWLASSAGQVEIALGEPITSALVNLALNQMGLPPDEGAWLREGLVLHYEQGTRAEYLPTLASTGVRTPLLDFPALEGLPDRQAQDLRALAWMATEYLLDRYGKDSLRDLCTAWGRGGGHSAFQAALGISSEQFESTWRGDWLASLRADAESIQDTIAARAAAVIEGDEVDYLSTVTLANRSLRTEERHWLADLAGRTLVTHTITGELVGWTAGASEATVALSVNTVITGESPAQASYDARFVREGDRWLYAGLAWNEISGDHLTLRYQNHDEAWAQRILELAEAAYDQVTADLQLEPASPVQIKVYDDHATLLALISPTTRDQVNSWTSEGESIRLWHRDDDEQSVQSTMAGEIARQVLDSRGLDIAWLREGIAIFEADRLRPLGTHWGAARYAPVAQEAVRAHEELPMDDLVSFEPLSQDRLEVARAQSWSLVAYVVDKYGLPDLQSLVSEAIATDSTDRSLRAVLGMDTEPFMAQWQQYAASAGVPNGLVSMAQRFDGVTAQSHIDVLASPDLAGREAGAPGSDLAAAYIAGRFAALGLEPLGDPLQTSVTVTGTETMTTTGGLGYAQLVPISYTSITEVPSLVLSDGDGTPLRRFTYREEFMEIAGTGTAHGRLTWVHTDDLERLGFGGAVVLVQEQEVEDPIAYAARLQRSGAGGLIVGTKKEPHQFQTGHTQPITASDVSIPVFELTEDAFQVLLDHLGLTQRDLSFAPPVLPLDAQMKQTLVHSPLTETLTANVLGLLPGNDPDLADETIIVGAHYDHVGQAPDGLYFPGGNTNASGVAALLEMARVWQAAGFRPARSVLFAAWGAEELDSAGVSHYLTRPAVPLSHTVGVIALDSVGNGNGFRLLFYGAQDTDLALVYRIEAGTAELNRRAQRKFATGEGWHSLFSAAGVPATKLFWDGADENAYLPTDTAEYIDPERLAFSGEILTLATSWLAGP